MIRVHVVVEGQTEETFIRDVLFNYFSSKNIFLNPIIVRTSKTGKGGGSSYGKLRNDIKRKCKEDQHSFVTTMWDYYGLPTDFPGKESIVSNDLFGSINKVEQAFQADINEKNFIPNLIVHEFEGLLFSDLDAFSMFMSVSDINCLKEQIKNFPSPEHVNNHRETAPSKRIIKHFPKYRKIYHGSTISSEIGIDKIRQKCQHFNNWLIKIEKLFSMYSMHR